MNRRSIRMARSGCRGPRTRRDEQAATVHRRYRTAPQAVIERQIASVVSGISQIEHDPEPIPVRSLPMPKLQRSAATASSPPGYQWRAYASARALPFALLPDDQLRALWPATGGTCTGLHLLDPCMLFGGRPRSQTSISEYAGNGGTAFRSTLTTTLEIDDRGAGADHTTGANQSA